MNAKTALIVVLVVFAIVGLLLLFGGGSPAANMAGASVDGSGLFGGRWLPVLLVIALLAVVSWFVKGSD